MMALRLAAGTLGFIWFMAGIGAFLSIWGN